MTHRRRRCCCCPIPVQCNQISCGKRHMFNQLRTRRRHIEQDALRVGSNLCISYCPPPPTPPWMAFRKLPTNRLSSPFVIPLPLPAAAAPPTSCQVRIVGPSPTVIGFALTQSFLGQLPSTIHLWDLLGCCRGTIQPNLGPLQVILLKPIIYLLIFFPWFPPPKETIQCYDHKTREERLGWAWWRRPCLLVWWARVLDVEWVENNDGGRGRSPHNNSNNNIICKCGGNY